MPPKRPRQPRRKPATPPALPAPTPAPAPDFTPVPLRPRHDGWTPHRQADFIQALAESGCVAEACDRVAMSEASAYRLRARPGAISFRNAWDAALDYAVRRLSDAAFARALNGVAVPVFFQGEQIGERRYYDERLTMFLLRYRDPLGYGKWRDRMTQEGHPEAPAVRLAMAVKETFDDADLPPGELPARNARRLKDITREARRRNGDPDWDEDPDVEDEDEEAAEEAGTDGDVA